VIRYFLLIVFVALIGSRALGLDLGLGPGLSIKNALLYATALLIAIDGAITRNRQVELLPVILPFALLITYAVGSWIFVVVFLDYPNYSPLATFIRLKTKLVDQFIVLVVFFYGVVNWRDAVWLLKSITWVVVVGCLVTVVDTFNIPDLGIVTARTFDGRVEGIMASAGEFSGLLAFFLPAMVALVWAETGFVRKLAVVGVGLGVVSILIAASRGAMVGLIISSIASAIYLRRYISAQIVLRATLAVFMLIAVAVVVVMSTEFGSILQERMSTGLESGDAQEISSGRTIIWLAALREMADYPLSFIIGLGWESYFQAVGYRYATHNVYLDRIYNLGLIGLLLFVLTYVNAIVIARRGLQHAPKQAIPFLMATVVGMAAMMITMTFADLENAVTLSLAYAGLTLRIAIGTTLRADRQLEPQPIDDRWNRDQRKPATRPMSVTPKR
jgi:O-antigen ligase